MEKENKIIIYKTKDGKTEIDVNMQNETLWLNVEKIALLFDKDRTTIQRHIKHIFAEKELEEKTTCAFFAQVQKEGKREVTRNIPHYNLDIILAVGYRTT